MVPAAGGDRSAPGGGPAAELAEEGAQLALRQTEAARDRAEQATNALAALSKQLEIIEKTAPADVIAETQARQLRETLATVKELQDKAATTVRQSDDSVKQINTLQRQIQKK